jgi:hypothetical protein
LLIRISHFLEIWCLVHWNFREAARAFGTAAIHERRFRVNKNFSSSQTFVWSRRQTLTLFPSHRQGLADGLGGRSYPSVLASCQLQQRRQHDRVRCGRPIYAAVWRNAA